MSHIGRFCLWWPSSLFPNPPFWVCTGAGERCGSTKHTSLVFQVELFSFSTDRYLRFYPQQLSSPHQAPLCCFIATHLLPNCFQYRLLGILLSGISPVVIRTRPHTVWITHSQAMVHARPVLRVTFFNSFRTSLSVCLFRFPNICQLLSTNMWLRGLLFVPSSHPLIVNLSTSPMPASILIRNSFLKALSLSISIRDQCLWEDPTVVSCGGIVLWVQPRHPRHSNHLPDGLLTLLGSSS